MALLGVAETSLFGMRKPNGRECVDCDGYWTWDLRAVPKHQKAETKAARKAEIHSSKEKHEEWKTGPFQKFMDMRAQNGGKTPRAAKSTVSSHSQVHDADKGASFERARSGSTSS